MTKFLVTLILLFFSDNIFPQSSLILNWDEHKSPIASAENLLTLHNTVYNFTDSKIKNKYWEENNWHRKLGGMSYRFAKSVFLDNQSDHLVYIHQHEVFGHGFRFREFELKDNSYKLSLFPPYGSGGGFARFGTADYDRRFGIHENIAIYTGGVEATSILSERLRNKWLQSGKIHYRESFLFFYALHNLTGYIRGTKTGAFDVPGNDVNNFLRLVNARYGFNSEENYQLTINDLSRRSTLGLFNTFQFFALYSYFKNYLYDAKDTFRYPMFRFGKIKWLPSAGFGLTPFGSEFIIENFLKTNKFLAQIRLRLGDGKLDNFWGGGISYRRDWTAKLTVNAIADFWIQPSLELGGESLFDTRKGLGGRLIAEIDYQFSHKYPIGGFAQIGYKTTGFYPGEILDKGVIARLGISFRTTKG